MSTADTMHNANASITLHWGSFYGQGIDSLLLWSSSGI